MNLNLNDDNKHLIFAPLTFTRPVGLLRMGILTNEERWKLLFPEAKIGFETEDYLADKFAAMPTAVSVNAALIPNAEVVEAVKLLKGNEQLVAEGFWIARSGTGEILIEFKGKTPVRLEQRWHLYQRNAEVLHADFELLTEGRVSQVISKSNTIIGNPAQIFLEAGARVEASVLNTLSGPIYIGKNAEVMEGCLLRGS